METRKRLTPRISWILISAIIFFQYGCKKKTDDSNQNQQNIPATTKVIDSTSWRNNFISVDTSNYTFTFKNSILNQVGLKQGDILVSAIGHGYLRKVDSLRQTGSNTIVYSSFAKLTDAVRNGSFTINSKLTTSKIKDVIYLRKGVIINTLNRKSNEDSDMEYNIDTYLDNGQLIHLTGQFSIVPTITCGLVINGFCIQSFHLSYDVQEQINLAASLNLLNLAYNNEVELANVSFEPIIVWIDFIPVVLVPKIQIDAGIELNVQSAVSTSANQHLTYSVGLNYANNQWTPFQTFTNTFSYQPPTLTATAGAKVYIKPKLQIAVYGFTSPYLFGEGFTRIQADLLANPWWSLYAGASVGAGVHMGIFGINYDYETDPPFFDYESLLSSAPGQLPTISTNSVSNITQTSAISGGNITSQGSSAVTARGVCWSISQNPTIANSHTTDGSGTGSFTSNITGLVANTPYYVRAYATNNVGTAYGNQSSFTTTSNSGGQPCPGTPTVLYEGKTYNTVQIGTQCWFKENLNVGTRINANQQQNNNGIIEKYCYNDDENNCSIYGGLYQWNEMMQYMTNQGAKGICPSGWHIPTDGEWCTVTQFLDPNIDCNIVGARLGTTEGGKMKSTGTIEAGTGLWHTPNTGATNSSGFTALPSGYGFTGGFYEQGNYALLWSSSLKDTSLAWTRLITNDQEVVTKGYEYINLTGFPCRCIKN